MSGSIRRLKTELSSAASPALRNMLTASLNQSPEKPSLRSSLNAARSGSGGCKYVTQVLEAECPFWLDTRAIVWWH